MEKQKFQRCEDCRTAAKSTFFEKALGIVEGHLAGLSHSPLTSLDSEERKAVEAHNIEVERRRSMAIAYQRLSMLR